MLEKFLVLLERFVVAHELIAANSAKQVVHAAAPLEVETVVYTKEAVAESAKADAKELPDEGENALERLAEAADKQNKAKSTNKSGEVIEAQKRKPRKAKVEEPTPEPEEIDYQSLRDQIQAIDDAINEGPSDAACDDSDELLEEFTGKKMKIAAIKDEDLAEYLERLTAIKNKYFEEE